MKVQSLEELKRLATEPTEFAIVLQGGLVARKLICYDPEADTFWVDDYVTGHGTEYSEEDLAKNTNILRAIKAGAFRIVQD